jgi:Tol biopolymer transport system component
MTQFRFILCVCIFSLAISSCTIELSPDATAIPATQVPATSSLGNPAQKNAIGNPSLPTFNIPVSWGDLHLSGKLIYTSSGQNGNTAYSSIQALDLATGQGTTIFEAPQNALIYFVTVSPDSKQLVMAYSPPPGADLSAHQELYSLPLDGSTAPQLLFTPATPDDEYFQPQWSADGKYIYFTYVNFHAPQSMPKQHYPVYEVFRMAYPDGQPEKLVDQAYWPTLSADLSHLVYVSLNPLDGKNNLFVANADGSNPQNLSSLSQGIPDVVDAPIFSPDNQSILFSAVVPAQSSAPTWLDEILGMTIASAHTLPSDWWSIPLTGGTPTQLTHIMAVGLFGSISPDKQYIASYSGAGIFVMKPDGTQSTMLISDVSGQPGTVSWIP